MAIPQIKLKINDIQMNYKTYSPKLQISQPQADLSITQPDAIVTITNKLGTLHIDQSQAFAEAGLKPISQMNKEYVEKGKQAVLQMISKRAQQGEQLLQNVGKGQQRAALQQIATQNSSVQPPAKFNVKFIPSPGAVKVDYTPGEFDIHVQEQKPQIDVQVNKPKINLTYGSIEANLVQRPSVEVYI